MNLLNSLIYAHGQYQDSQKPKTLKTEEDVERNVEKPIKLNVKSSEEEIECLIDNRKNVS
jgi:hypothetical protein